MDTDLTPRPDCLLLKWATSCSAEITSWLAVLRRTCKCFSCPRLKTECAGCSHLTVPPLTVLFMLSRRRSLASLRLQRSSSSMRVSRLSVSLQSSFTAPTFSMKIRSLKRRQCHNARQKTSYLLSSTLKTSCCCYVESAYLKIFITLLTTSRLAMVSPLAHTTSPPSFTASGKICWTSWAITPARGQNMCGSLHFHCRWNQIWNKWSPRSRETMEYWSNDRGMARCGQTETGELWNVTGLCSVLYAHGGSKLRLVLIMHQPHLRNPFQIVCGVDLRTHTQWKWGMKTRWSHIWIECNRKTRRWSFWTRRWKSTRGSQWHTLKHQPVWTHGGAVLTSCTFSLALMSDGCTSEPMTFRLPWTTRASSGRSVLMPTLPWW